ncbi:MAG TPA: hypothetical protein VHH36_03430 [Candidatus Thermoplasmatota archaeon]|nr:hypothetical protein [Candidatus Thermoplasmatota archaeon]
MTRHPSLRTAFRVLVAAATSALVLASFPPASAGPVVDAPDVAAKSCTRHVYTGGYGVVNFYSDDPWWNDLRDHQAFGHAWVDGCGGKACDDSVEGYISTGRNGGTAHFSVIERYGQNDDCLVVCEVDGWVPENDLVVGYVIPHGADNVFFSCDGWKYAFGGHLGAGSPDALVEPIYVQTVPPAP